MPNEDLNKIRDAARRVHRIPGSPPPPPPSASRAAPSRAVPPRPTARPTPTPARPVASRPTGAGSRTAGEWFRSRAEGLLWAWLAALLAVWVAGALRQMWWGSGYQPARGADVGRLAAGPQGELIVAAGAFCLLAVVLFGRWGAVLAVAAASLVGAVPGLLPHGRFEAWFIDPVPAALRELLVDLGGASGTRLGWAVAGCAVAALSCLGRASYVLRPDA